MPSSSSPVRRLSALWIWVRREMKPPSFTFIDSITEYKYSRYPDNPCNNNRDDPVTVIILELVEFAWRRYDFKFPSLGRAGHRLLRAADDHGRHHHRQRGAALHAARPWFFPGQPDLGGQRVPDRVWKFPSGCRSPRRPDRPAQGLPRGRLPVHGG